MKIAIVYNRESKKVINLFGVPNREKYGLKSIKRITDALRKGGHQVIALEGDKDLIDKLEEFMPSVLKSERPGMVFNLSYGIQGQARYTHVPGMLEMVGIPYVGSGPLAHSLSLDKVVAKMIFRQNGLPTPDFAVLEAPDFAMPDLAFPMIVKPKNEAVSFGLRVVEDEAELRDAAGVIFAEFEQPVLVEQYIDGREINVGVLGNSPPEAFPPVELDFGDGPKIYSYEDKTHKSGRTVQPVCPARVPDDIDEQARKLAVKAFSALGCYDCARVDMRLDQKGNLYLLEINSLPSLADHGSFLAAAAAVGLDFGALVNRLVEVSSARYFGTPAPPQIDRKNSTPESHVFNYLTGRRDRMEKRLEDWCSLSSRTFDPVGLQGAVKRLEEIMLDLRLKANRDITDDRSVWAWETPTGLDGGTLLIGQLDIPLDPGVSVQTFRRDPEWLFGEGIGCSRAPLVMLEYALRALRHARRLRKSSLGVLYYTDEGRDCRYSAAAIRSAMNRAKRILVMRAANEGERVITQRRGQRKFHFKAQGRPLKPGQIVRRPGTLRWACSKLEEFAQLSSKRNRVGVATVNMKTRAFPMLLPHSVEATILLSYLDPANADRAEEEMRKKADGNGYKWGLELISDRPPLKERRRNLHLAKQMGAVADRWEIPFKSEASVWPSVAGLAPASVPVLCGVGPTARDLYTPQEAVQRISFIQRTLLLAQFLVEHGR